MVVLAERRYYKSGIPARQGGLQLLDQALHDDLRHRRRDRHHHGVRLRHQLGRLLALRRRHLRRAAGGRGPVRLLPRVDVPRRPALRPQEGLAAASTTPPPGWSSSARTCRRCGSSIANSWQQTPAATRSQDGRAELTDFWAAVFNPSTLARATSTPSSRAWIAGCFVVAGISRLVPAQGRHRAVRPHAR